MSSAPPQKIELLSLHLGGELLAWDQLSTLNFSEVLRELAYLVQ